MGEMMKNHSWIKYLIISFIIVVIITVVMIFLYQNTTAKSLDINDKITDELTYLDTTLISMLNGLSNLNTASLLISNESSGSGSQSTSQGSDSSEGSSSEDSSDSQGSGNQSKQQNIVKYELMQEPVLDKDKDDIDWRELEDTAESLYNSWATITIDLNSQNVSKNDILMFNTNLDNLMNSLKNKDKKNSKICLANLYSSLPKYMEQTSQDSNAISFRRVKANVLFSYAMLDTGDWDSINKFLSQAEVDLKNLMETGNVNGNFKKSTVDKSYVLLRELIKTGNEKNIDLFYVKYMNLIAELEKA